jgi:CrcB protein
MSWTQLGPLGWALLATGGMLGTLARFGLGSWIVHSAVARGWPSVLGAPVGTWVVNVLGCVAIGLVAALAAGDPPRLPPEARVFLAVGFCGAFTTFSTLGLETATLLQHGRWGPALLYVLCSNIGGVLAVMGGLALGRAGSG